MTVHAENDSHPLEQIATQHSSSETEADDIDESHDSAKATEPKAATTAFPKITATKVQEPALLLDENLCIVWQNRTAKDFIWHDAGAVSNGNPTPDVFDLLFDPHFKRRVENWRKWVLFFLLQAHHMLSKDQLEQMIEPREESQKEIITEMLQQTPPHEEGSASNGRMRQLLNDGRLISFWVVATQFDQGRYIVFQKTAKTNDATHTYRCAEIEQRFEVIRRLGRPSPVPISVLAARLDKSHILRNEMLAEEYSSLLTRLYNQTIEVVEKHGGIFQKLTGSEFLICFFSGPQQDENLPHQVIDCALELKELMADLAREWKIRKGWLHDLELDMGLHWAEEYIGTVTSSLTDHMTAFGDAQSVATTLSHLACDGQIWATKALINRIPSHEQKKLRFGIFRKGQPHQVLVSRYFSRLKDMAGGDRITAEELVGEFGNFAATQIFDRQA